VKRFLFFGSSILLSLFITVLLYVGFKNREWHMECFYLYRGMLGESYTEGQAREFYKLCERLGTKIEPKKLHQAYVVGNRQEWYEVWIQGTEAIVMERLDMTMRKVEEEKRLHKRGYLDSF
jgi:hypothetical protein